MQTAGIFIEHNAKGVPIFARIDLKKYGSELKDFFSEKGISIEESTYNPDLLLKSKRARNKYGMGNIGLSKPKIYGSKIFFQCLARY